MSGTTHCDREQQQNQQHHVYSWRNEARTDTSNFLLLFSLKHQIWMDTPTKFGFRHYFRAFKTSAQMWNSKEAKL